MSTAQRQPYMDLHAATGRLEGRVAVVVGGGATGEDPAQPGTGEAAARVFAAAGAKVAVVGRTAANTERTVDRISAAGGTAIAMLGDATETATCHRLVDDVVAEYGGLDILVNNLGLYGGTGVGETDDQTWDEVIAVNLRSPIAMARAAAPHLGESRRGSIINISAVSGMLASGSAPYGTTKAAMMALTREMALGFGAQGIRANCLVPGHLYTPTGSRNREDMRALRARLSMLGPEVEGSGWDIGWAALFLASDESRFITAAVLPVDGGVTQQLLQAALLRLGMTT